MPTSVGDVVKVDVFPVPNEFEPSVEPLDDLEFACAGLQNERMFNSVSTVDVERVSRDHAIIRISLAADLARAIPLLVVRRMPFVY